MDFSVEEFAQRLERYETVTEDLRRLLSCIAYWGVLLRAGLMPRGLMKVVQLIRRAI